MAFLSRGDVSLEAAHLNSHRILSGFVLSLCCLGSQPSSSLTCCTWLLICKGYTLSTFRLGAVKAYLKKVSFSPSPLYPMSPGSCQLPTLTSSLPVAFFSLCINKNSMCMYMSYAHMCTCVSMYLCTYVEVGDEWGTFLYHTPHYRY